MKKRVAGYIRVSSKDQTKGESLITQKKAIQKHIQSQGWKEMKIYADEGISGGSLIKRLSLQKLLEDAMT